MQVSLAFINTSLKIPLDESGLTGCVISPMPILVPCLGKSLSLSMLWSLLYVMIISSCSSLQILSIYILCPELRHQSGCIPLKLSFFTQCVNIWVSYMCCIFKKISYIKASVLNKSVILMFSICHQYYSVHKCYRK